MKNIRDVVDNALCCACGICAGICPVNAVTMNRNQANFLKAYIDNDKCVNCGKCRKCCPSVNDNIEYLVNLQDGKWEHGKHTLKGYIGYSCDCDIRKKSQSGGVTTSLLLYLLDKGDIKGALVNHFDKKTQSPDVFLASNRDEIVSGVGSYYVQTAVLKNIDKYDDSIATVVTGCQSEALTLRFKESGRRPNLIIGLACAGNYSLDYIYDLADIENTSQKINEFRFRDKRVGDWPGGVYIATNEKIIKKPLLKRTELKPCYASYRCMQCFDINNIFADIVVGDPWCFRQELDKEELKKGYTVIIARTEAGIKAIEGAKKAGYLTLQEKTSEKFLNHNSYAVCVKTQHVIDICKKEKYPIIYGEKYKSMFYSNLLQQKKRKYNLQKILKEIKHAYKLYNASSQNMVNDLIFKEKKYISREKMKNVPKFFIFGCLVKIRNTFRYIYRVVTR